ncbi:thioredoxin family protein [Candidatus Sumerlaeota bacterium]|nr:thioredoxin family protein [Candidatus Sumerlaeota bacterium]
MRRFFIVYIALVFSCLLASPAFPQNVIFFEDFEKGPATPVDKIKRYPMNPEIVSSDLNFPGAFPPPSGKFAARAMDKDHNFFGLGSIVAGPEIDLNKPEQKYAAIEAKIYLAPSTNGEMNNFALIALDDTLKTEKYYRFGYRKSTIYFSMFDGAGFMEAVYDPEMGASLVVPGWHAFSMRFDKTEKIFFYVDGKPTFFSPMGKKDIAMFRMGALGWDRKSFMPILADDFKVSLYSTPPEQTRITYQPAPGIPIATPTAPSPSTNTPITPHKNIWFEDTARAVQEAQRTGKKFLVFFYIQNHAKSQKLEQTVLNDPAVQKTLDKFVLVKINGRINTADADRYGIFKYPTLLVLDLQGRVYWEYVDIPYPQELDNSLARF